MRPRALAGSTLRCAVSWIDGVTAQFYPYDMSFLGARTRIINESSGETGGRQGDEQTAADDRVG